MERCSPEIRPASYQSDLFALRAPAHDREHRAREIHQTSRLIFSLNCSFSSSAAEPSRNGINIAVIGCSQKNPRSATSEFPECMRGPSLVRLGNQRTRLARATCQEFVWRHLDALR